MESLVSKTIEARSITPKNLQNGGGLIKWGLVYWLEIVHSALVRETILYSSMLRILFLVWSSDLPLQNSKKNFIGLFCILGNLEHFLFFLYPQDQKRVDFAIFWLLASRKEENFYLQVEKVEKVDSGTPGLSASDNLKVILCNSSALQLLSLKRLNYHFPDS